jgi:hypothetical protein
MEERKAGVKRPVKGKKVGLKHKKNLGPKPVFKKKESKTAQLKAAIESLTAQYETIEPKNIKKFR